MNTNDDEAPSTLSTDDALGNDDSELPIRLVAIDLDGTLLNSAKQVSQQTVDALRCLPSEVRVVIASARPPRSVRPIYQSLGLSTWQINYNGALIWDDPGARPVFHRPMAAELVQRIIAFSRGLFDEVLVSCEIMDRWFTDRADQTHTTETGRLFSPDVIAPYPSFCTQPITKLMLLGRTEMLSELEQALRDLFDDHISIVQTDRDLIQIMDKRVSKGIALKKVADHYGIRSRQIMAIGDAPNDVGMIKYAGVGVAMDNASEIVKSAADWIAPSNDDHGVHAALVKFGLCK
jgi:Cof subfamily protein (haloacid dehalogenase superfamily)